MTVHVRDAQHFEIDTVARLLGEAFAVDPSARRIVGDRAPGDAAEELTGLLEVIIRHHYLPAGRVDVAVGEDGTMLGAALWDRPGSSLGLKAQVLAAPRYLRLVGRRLPAVARDGLRFRGYPPKFPHWYLYMLGARPEARGKGVGTALLDHGLERAGDDPAYLEASTPASAALYERVGFVPLGESPVATPGYAPEIGMWRPGAMPGR